MANMDENKFLEVFVEVTVGSTKISPIDSTIYDIVYEKPHGVGSRQTLHAHSRLAAVYCRHLHA